VRPVLNEPSARNLKRTGNAAAQRSRSGAASVRAQCERTRCGESAEKDRGEIRRALHRAGANVRVNSHLLDRAREALRRADPMAALLPDWSCCSVTNYQTDWGTQLPWHREFHRTMPCPASEPVDSSVQAPGSLLVCVPRANGRANDRARDDRARDDRVPGGRVPSGNVVSHHADAAPPQKPRRAHAESLPIGWRTIRQSRGAIRSVETWQSDYPSPVIYDEPLAAAMSVPLACMPSGSYGDRLCHRIPLRNRFNRNLPKKAGLTHSWPVCLGPERHPVWISSAKASG
jgi:hypothetical protein